ncbi:MAG: chemotaxis protein CheX [Spirochaetia bacterium]|nr:chemotaxis protein CheX [Spirochaetia bacterium]
MTEQELRTFIKVVMTYFETVSGEPSRMGLPSIKRKDSPLSDFTGAIGISGARRGAVYFTAPRALMIDFAAQILGEGSHDDESLYDLVGEMTNTIAGNVRETFGPEFMISVPMIVKGNATDIDVRLANSVFLVPIEWRTHKCYLGIGLE